MNAIQKWEPNEPPLQDVYNHKGIRSLAYRAPIDELTLEQVEAEIEEAKKYLIEELQNNISISKTKEVIVNDEDILETLKVSAVNPFWRETEHFYWCNYLGSLYLIRDLWKKDIIILEKEVHLVSH